MSPYHLINPDTTPPPTPRINRSIFALMTEKGFFPHDLTEVLTYHHHPLPPPQMTNTQKPKLESPDFTHGVFWSCAKYQYDISYVNADSSTYIHVCIHSNTRRFCDHPCD
jgi:hypothetical protein